MFSLVVCNYVVIQFDPYLPGEKFEEFGRRNFQKFAHQSGGIGGDANFLTSKEIFTFIAGSFSLVVY